MPIPVALVTNSLAVLDFEKLRGRPASNNSQQFTNCLAKSKTLFDSSRRSGTCIETTAAFLCRFTLRSNMQTSFRSQISSFVMNYFFLRYIRSGLLSLLTNLPALPVLSPLSFQSPSPICHPHVIMSPLLPCVFPARRKDIIQRLRLAFLVHARLSS